MRHRTQHLDHACRNKEAMATQLSGGQVLSLSTDEHLSDNTQGSFPQIQNLTGGDDVRETKRGLLAQQLL